MNLLELSKILNDAENVVRAISRLSAPKNEVIKQSYHQLEQGKDFMDSRLKQITKTTHSRYHHQYHPISLKITDLTPEIIQLASAIQSKHNEIYIKASNNEYSFNKQDILWETIIKLKNPGTYHHSIAINGDLKKLADHPMKEQLEVLHLQDLDFSKYVDYDPSLWKIYEQCPNIAVIYLFEAQLSKSDIVNLHFEKMQNLKVLDLSSNFFYGIPEPIFQLKNLKYLSLGENFITLEQKERLKKELPSTYIVY